jgi:hypothetical protein
MTYRFEEFKTEITNPTIIINMANIVDNTILNKLMVSVILQTENAEMYGILLDNISYSVTWENSQIEAMVLARLKDFEI